MSSGGTLIEARDVRKSFGQTPALRGASVAVSRGEILAIMGPSGSGKSTLLHCLAGIFAPDSGEVWFDGSRMDTLDEAARTKLRRTAFGFVFQFGQLVPELTAADNVAMPLLLNRVRRRTAYQTADTWLEKLGIGDKGGRRTGELSGGEAQRVAIARALALGPKLIFADEPTGSLDSLTGEKVMDLLVGLAREQGTTVIIVTHDARVAAYADRVVMVRDGLVSFDLGRRVVGGEARGEGGQLMLRLGLRLTLRSGREALVRLAVTTAAVAVGVALLLGVLAEFHAFQAQSSQPCWACTSGDPVPSTLPASGELWNNSVDFYQGQTLTRLDVAALGADAPVLPGISRLPAAGQYYASPALAALLRTVPADELGDRFPGTMIGTIGQAGLTGPGQLAVYIGYTPTALNAIGGTTWVTSIAHRSRVGGVHPVLQVRVRHRGAGGPVPDAGADQHGHPAGGEPPGGAVRRAPAGRRDAGRHPDDRRGRVGGERVLRRGPRGRDLAAGAAPGGRRGADRDAVLLLHGDPRRLGVRRDRGRGAGDRARRGAGLAAPGADLAAGREPAGDAQAPDVLAADRAGARAWRSTCTGCRSPRTRASGPPPTPGCC